MLFQPDHPLSSVGDEPGDLANSNGLTLHKWLAVLVLYILESVDLPGHAG